MKKLLTTILLICSHANAANISDLSIYSDNGDTDLTLAFGPKDHYVYLSVGVVADKLTEKKPLYTMYWTYKDEKTGDIGPWQLLVNRPDGITIGDGFGLTLVADKLPDELYSRLADLTILLSINPVNASHENLRTFSVGRMCVRYPQHFVNSDNGKTGCP